MNKNEKGLQDSEEKQILLSIELPENRSQKQIKNIECLYKELSGNKYIINEIVLDKDVEDKAEMDSYEANDESDNKRKTKLYISDKEKLEFENLIYKIPRTIQRNKYTGGKKGLYLLNKSEFFHQLEANSSNKIDEFYLNLAEFTYTYYNTDKTLIKGIDYYLYPYFNDIKNIYNDIFQDYKGYFRTHHYLIINSLSVIFLLLKESSAESAIRVCVFKEFFAEVLNGIISSEKYIMFDVRTNFKSKYPELVTEINQRNMHLEIMKMYFTSDRKMEKLYWEHFFALIEKVINSDLFFANNRTKDQKNKLASEINNDVCMEFIRGNYYYALDIETYLNGKLKESIIKNRKRNVRLYLTEDEESLDLLDEVNDQIQAEENMNESVKQISESFFEDFRRKVEQLQKQSTPNSEEISMNNYLDFFNLYVDLFDKMEFIKKDWFYLKNDLVIYAIDKESEFLPEKFANTFIEWKLKQAKTKQFKLRTIFNEAAYLLHSLSYRTYHNLIKGEIIKDENDTQMRSFIAVLMPLNDKSLTYTPTGLSKIHEYLFYDLDYIEYFRSKKNPYGQLLMELPDIKISTKRLKEEGYKV